ncbi:MAG: hypothetical protein IJ662_10980 [Clostridia bacterium]|nr:hypothetical protein [Clostridia bacterium]
MKKLALVLLICLTALTLTGCASGDKNGASNAGTTAQVQKIDLDLSQMSGTIVYSQVSNILADPSAYTGKVIKMTGYYDVFEDTSSGNTYFSCIIPDATACCAQGFEFVWAGEHAYPNDYPAPGTGVTVTGRFETYTEDEYLYVHLVDADVEWDKA